MRPPSLYYEIWSTLSHGSGAILPVRVLVGVLSEPSGGLLRTCWRSSGSSQGGSLEVRFGFHGPCWRAWG
eukprot:4040056-Pyramimonas_sp.AAC.1